MKFRLFISSVQREFAEERRLLAEWLRADAILGQFFSPFLFENVPACDASPQGVYLDEVAGCDVYLLLAGAEYGFEDAEGVSPTEREYDRATALHKPRLAFVKRTPERAAKETAFLRKVERAHVRRSFDSFEELRTAVYAALARFLEEREVLRILPFDAAKDSGAKATDLDADRMADFLRVARARRGLPLPEGTPPKSLLEHLDLAGDDGRVTNAAVLLFGRRPQRFFPASEVKCCQFYGTRVEKPMSSLQIYKGDVFQLVDAATDFVMGRIDNWVGTRSSGRTAEVPTKFELPQEAVKEAIVNAVCHRDYTSLASVQVMLFRDRLEIWSPGPLPRGMTVEKLTRPHRSIPVNPLLAQAMYLKGYVEKAGTGTEDMADLCRKWGLPPPEFVLDDDFKVVLRRPAAAARPANGRNAATDDARPEQWPQSWPQSWPRTTSNKILSLLFFGESSRRNLCSRIGVEPKSRSFRLALDRLIEAGQVEPTIPGKPNSRLQAYRLTKAGRRNLLQGNQT